MLGLAAASWLVAVRQMNGMDIGVATDLGPFQLFVAVWASMVGAMMLPAAASTVSRRRKNGFRRHHPDGARRPGRRRAQLLLLGTRRRTALARLDGPGVQP
jgi:predicted metal-binding membrane protein